MGLPAVPSVHLKIWHLGCYIPSIDHGNGKCPVKKKWDLCGKIIRCHVGVPGSISLGSTSIKFSHVVPVCIASWSCRCTSCIKSCPSPLRRGPPEVLEVDASVSMPRDGSGHVGHMARWRLTNPLVNSQYVATRNALFVDICTVVDTSWNKDFYFASISMCHQSCGQNWCFKMF